MRPVSLSTLCYNPRRANENREAGWKAHTAPAAVRCIRIDRATVYHRVNGKASMAHKPSPKTDLLA